LREFVAVLQYVRVGHLLIADVHTDGGAVFCYQRPQLLEQVRAEESGFGNRRGINAGCLELTPGAAGDGHRAARFPNQAKFGIAEASPLFRIRRRTTRGKSCQCVTLRLHRLGM
jgi:hypothetical protein